jgi:hypothetical protein
MCDDFAVGFMVLAAGRRPVQARRSQQHRYYVRGDAASSVAARPSSLEISRLHILPHFVLRSVAPLTAARVWYSVWFTAPILSEIPAPTFVSCSTHYFRDYPVQLLRAE